MSETTAACQHGSTTELEERKNTCLDLVVYLSVLYMLSSIGRIGGQYPIKESWLLVKVYRVALVVRHMHVCLNDTATGLRTRRCLVGQSDYRQSRSLSASVSMRSRSRFKNQAYHIVGNESLTWEYRRRRNAHKSICIFARRKFQRQVDGTSSGIPENMPTTSSIFGG